MPDELQGTAATGTTDIQSAPAQDTGQPQPQSTETPDAQSITANTAADGGAEDSFFDPRSIADKPELMAAYKQMQKAFTKKTQEIADFRKVYDNYRSDPIRAIQQEAARMGYRLTRAEAEQVQAKQGQQAPQNDPTEIGPDWQPQTWQELLDVAERRAEQRLMQKFNPVLSEVTAMKRGAVEAHLDQQFPEWRQYEPQMVELLGKHPTLANDLETLIDMTLPREEREKRMEAAVMKKIEARSKAASVNGSSTTKQNPPKPQATNIRDAIAQAQEDLERQGIRPPAGFRM